MSNNRYTDWITQHVPDDSVSQCREITALMADAFPELRRIRGHYDCPIWGLRTHWWLLAPDGAVVDPTAAQFPSGGIGEYRPHHDGDPEPTGTCLNCGAYAYRHQTFCSDRCDAVTTAEFNRDLRRRG